MFILENLPWNCSNNSCLKFARNAQNFWFVNPNIIDSQPLALSRRSPMAMEGLAANAFAAASAAAASAAYAAAAAAAAAAVIPFLHCVNKYLPWDFDCPHGPLHCFTFDWGEGIAFPWTLIIDEPSSRVCITQLYIVARQRWSRSFCHGSCGRLRPRESQKFGRRRGIYSCSLVYSVYIWGTLIQNIWGLNRSKEREQERETQPWTQRLWCHDGGGTTIATLGFYPTVELAAKASRV